MLAFLTSRVNSFGHAFRGLAHALRTQRNAWIHSAVSIIVIVLAIWLTLPARDWAVLILTIALVFTAEFINTAIEAVVDLATSEHHPLAKVGKDVGAAAVLVASIAAVLIGLLILGPPLLAKITDLTQPQAQANQLAFKGMELYSWQNAQGEWQYILLPGTNRGKTFDEIQVAPLDLQGIETALAQLPSDESVFWTNNVFDTQSNQMMSLPFPAQDILNEIKELARSHNINLFLP